MVKWQTPDVHERTPKSIERDQRVTVVSSKEAVTGALLLSQWEESNIKPEARRVWTLRLDDGTAYRIEGRVQYPEK